MAPSKSDVNKRWVLLFLKVEKSETLGSRADAARKLNIQPQRLNEILQGRMNVGTDIIQKSVIEFGFNLFYIFFEKLPFFLSVDSYVAIIRRGLPVIVEPYPHRMEAEPDLSTVNEPASKYEKNLPKFKLSDGTEISLAALTVMLADYNLKKGKKKSKASGKRKRK